MRRDELIPRGVRPGTASALTSMTSAARPAARRSSFPAPIRNSPRCSPRRCRERRRHRRGEVGRARSGRARQDRRGAPRIRASTRSAVPVGMRGSRVQAVANELQGEKIDIIPWSPDP